MGNSKSKIAFEICIVTGDHRDVESAPAILMVLFDERNNCSPTLTFNDLIQLEDNLIQAKYTINYADWCKSKNFNNLEKIEFWRTMIGPEPLDWFVDKIIIRDRRRGIKGYWEYAFFPVHRWINTDQHVVVYNCQTFLPHQDPFPDIRDTELLTNQEILELTQRSKGFPVEVGEIPPEEYFSYDEKWNIEEAKFNAINGRRLNVLYEDKTFLQSYSDLFDMFSTYNITEPMSLHQSILEDVCFGAQRLKGCNPLTLRQCEAIPENLGLVMELIKPHLEGWTMRQIIRARRLYMIDYSIMEGLECKQNRQIPAPIALFFFTETKQLKPLAIQLRQQIQEGNPTFIPSDPASVWLRAKMWFNLADSVYHLIVCRLMNHMILESIWATLKRNMSQSHPVYQLLAPHMESLFVVTKTLKNFVYNEDGWIASNLQLSGKGVKQLIKRAFKEWTFEIYANIHRDFESRGVYDLSVFSNYPYRDDALLLYKAYHTYVKKLVELYYPRGRDDLIKDVELQNWRNELANPMEEGGLGLRGIPGGLITSNAAKMGARSASNGSLSVLNGANGGATTHSVHSAHSANTLNVANSLSMPEDAVRLLTGLLHLSITVCGAALRLPMYDEYGNPMHYPMQLLGEMPTDPAMGGANRVGGHDGDGDDDGDGDEDDDELMGAARTADEFMAEQEMEEGEREQRRIRARTRRAVRHLPNRSAMVDTLISIRMCARVSQPLLGNFQSDYLYQPDAVRIVEQFKAQLNAASRTIGERNAARDIYHQYLCLDPSMMPNSPGV